MDMGHGFASCFSNPHVSWLYPMVYLGVTQRSAICTIPKSMISSEIENYGELVMVERLEEAQGRRAGRL